jgi:hypothetical protein
MFVSSCSQLHDAANIVGSGDDRLHDGCVADGRGTDSKVPRSVQTPRAWI